MCPACLTTAALAVARSTGLVLPTCRKFSKILERAPACWNGPRNVQQLILSNTHGHLGCCSRWPFCFRHRPCDCSLSGVSWRREGRGGIVWLAAGTHHVDWLLKDKGAVTYRAGGVIGGAVARALEE
jgi:hypothetical protein